LNKDNKAFWKNSIWALTNFCRGKPKPQYEVVREAFGIFVMVVNDETNFSE